MSRKQVNNKETNTGNDLLFDYFRDNLENIELPVSDVCWENISQQIADEPRKRGKRFILFVSSAAAIFLIALTSGIFFFVADNSINKLTVEQIETPIINVVPETQEIKKQIIEEQNKEENNLSTHHPVIVAQVMSNNTQAKTSKPDIRSKTEENASESILTEQPTSEGSNTNRFIESSALTDNDDSNKQPEENEQLSVAANMDAQENMNIQSQDSIDLVRREKEMQQLQDLYDGKEEDIFAAAATLSSNKEEGKWGISASFASATSSSKAVHQTRPVNTLSINEVFLASKKSESATDIDYAPPFSAGVTVSKQLNNRFAIETGVVYSYLSTKYKDLDRNSYNTKVKLHYVGVPVNVLVNIWDINSRFKVYASAGAMLEKGLKFDFTQDNIVENQKVKESRSIKGVQWSLNGSVGASYRFYDKWNVYFEPQVSHYFNNNQPISIRTEKGTIFSLNTGIRYQF